MWDQSWAQGPTQVQQTTKNNKIEKKSFNHLKKEIIDNCKKDRSEKGEKWKEVQIKGKWNKTLCGHGR